MAENEKEVFSANSLHEMLGIPYSYLRTVLISLARKGLVRAVSGRNGGYMLAREKSKIFLSDIIEVNEDLKELDKCMLGFEKCNFNNECIFHSLWEKMRNEILDKLRTTAIEDLKKQYNPIK